MNLLRGSDDPAANARLKFGVTGVNGSYTVTRGECGNLAARRTENGLRNAAVLGFCCRKPLGRYKILVPSHASFRSDDGRSGSDPVGRKALFEDVSSCQRPSCRLLPVISDLLNGKTSPRPGLVHGRKSYCCPQKGISTAKKGNPNGCSNEDGNVCRIRGVRHSGDSAHPSVKR